MLFRNRITTAAALLTALSLGAAVTISAAGTAETESGTDKEHTESGLLSADILSVTIQAEDLSEEGTDCLGAGKVYTQADVTINGTVYEDVGIRPAGRSGFSEDGTVGRLYLQFDAYTEGQTAFGLDSLLLRSISGDSTYMRQYLTYDLLNAAGVETPEYGFASLEVNEEAQGLYLALGTAETEETEEDTDRDSIREALEALEEGGNPEDYIDVDPILRSMAAGTLLLNLNGQDASDVVNAPIDPAAAGETAERQNLLSLLLANEEYLESYHGYMETLIEQYFADGKFDAKVDALDDMIGETIQNDPNAPYTAEEHIAGVAALKELVSLRIKSVQGQLDGTIPSTAEGQEADPDSLIPTGDLDLSVLGGGSGKGRSGMAGFFGEIRGASGHGGHRNPGGFKNGGHWGGQQAWPDNGTETPDSGTGESAEDITEAANFA